MGRLYSPAILAGVHAGPEVLALGASKLCLGRPVRSTTFYRNISLPASTALRRILSGGKQAQLLLFRPEFNRSCFSTFSIPLAGPAHGLAPPNHVPLSEERAMRSRCVRLILLVAAGFAASSAEAQLWKHFVPTARSVDTQADEKLTPEKGPWLILAASFSGAGAEEQSQELAAELRQRYHLKAYVHQMSFDFSDQDNKPPGRGVDEYGAPIRRRFQRGDRVTELAVLVGDFPSVEDPEAQAALETIKTAQPAALAVKEGEQSAQSLAQVREWHEQFLEKLGKKRDRGPMGQAFITRNPLLPPEYFVPKGVDDFVAKMNRGVKHSLLDCSGTYTVRVATFRGKTSLQTGREQEEKQSMWSWKKKIGADNPLIEAAENAHLLTEELRAHGWEAYEFHDRTESFVAIGSFEQVGQQTSDGQLTPTPEVQRIIETFGGAYDTPADPLTNIGNDVATKNRVLQKQQEFNMRLAAQQGTIVPGMNPKHVKIFKGSGKQQTIDRVIPLDVTPQAIEAPKRSLSSAYAG
jgi:hypothetical protein